MRTGATDWGAFRSATQNVTDGRPVAVSATDLPSGGPTSSGAWRRLADHSRQSARGSAGTAPVAACAGSAASVEGSSVPRARPMTSIRW